MFISHLLANLWVHIGMYQRHNVNDGWIVASIGKGIQEDNYYSLYVTSFYWIITSFSSVGYGEIVGLTEIEYTYQCFVEMVGIGFFGYMVGTF